MYVRDAEPSPCTSYSDTNLKTPAGTPQQLLSDDEVGELHKHTHLTVLLINTCKKQWASHNTQCQGEERREHALKIGCQRASKRQRNKLVRYE